MTRVQKAFLDALTKSWAQEFTFLRPVDLDEIPKRPRGTNFLCDKYFAERSRVYFLSVDFGRKITEEFRISVTISVSSEHSMGDIGWPEKLERLEPATYGLNFFTTQQDHAWLIEDYDVRMEAHIKELNVPNWQPMVLPNRWRPASWQLPQEEIFRQAIENVNATLRQHVFPKLNITVESKG